jgi:hypothetical protein
VRSVPVTKQYRAMNVKFLVQGNNGLPLTGFGPTRFQTRRFLVRRLNFSAVPSQSCTASTTLITQTIKVFLTYTKVNNLKFISHVFIYHIVFNLISYNSFLLIMKEGVIRYIEWNLNTKPNTGGEHYLRQVLF